MPSFTYLTGVTAATETLATGETGYIGVGATLNGSILGTANDNYVQVNGAIVTTSTTVSLALTSQDSTVVVGTTGTITNLSASGIGVEVDVAGGASVVSSRIFNAGEVFGRQIGIFAHTVDLDDRLTIQNTGSILGQDTGILIHGGGSEVIINTGTINGFLRGISNLSEAYFTSGPDVTVMNTGTIQGSLVSIQTGAQDDSITNRGLLLGNVEMGAGLDLLDNRGGRVEGDVHLGDSNDRYVGTGGGSLSGAVYGDAGSDTFFGNENAADVFVGGADVDTLDFRLGGQVTLALDLSFAQSGAALGDTYFEMENVFGSDIGNDVIRGNGATNALFGFAGADSLDGAGGADVLRGGTGIDTLTGGTGDDTFRFSALNECGDLITDFAGNLGNNDRFQITAAAFGGGLVAGALAANQFQTRADNIAQDADDRFIFNTTDRTLWFDADGSGAGAAIMVADLQAGAVVTAADILLI